ncbi:hypothetical protein SAMN04488519_10746 [Algoriphagus ornithinivorans]|uniref:Uncharacterized protein n=1 Tax=Algoriphagus ornithinivorans TaxID=226506 RepID=A0A1I5HHZ9_9BACT|nr:hypothetical protein SAMN04488519_10746 [Algoriphagus ornithinivorans]
MPSAKYLKRYCSRYFQDMPSARKTSNQSRIKSSVGAINILAVGFNPRITVNRSHPSAGAIASFGNDNSMPARRYGNHIITLQGFS